MVSRKGVFGILLEAGSILRTVDCSLESQEVVRREADWLSSLENGANPMEE